MNYEELTDFEINEQVIKLLIKSGVFTDQHDDVSGKIYVSDGWCWGPGVETGLVKDGKHFVTHHNGYKLDYCNDPADAWPIITGNKINIRFGAEGMPCEAQFMQYGCESVECYHNNPLRAAMIVFLMMQENE